MYGVATGAYHIFPFSIISEIKDFVDMEQKPITKIHSESDYLNSLFTERIPDTELLYEPITSWNGLKTRINELKLLSPDKFQDAYQNIKVVELNPDSKIYSLSFEINGKTHTSYSYFKEGNPKCGVLIIPGSGDDQALAIINGEGYQGNILFLTEYCDVYVLILPNHGYRSIHNEVNRLDDILNLYVGLINSGYSYTVTYLVEALAWVKHLQDNYEYVGTAGLSQGGYATLLTSLQSQPDFAIISSGFSIYLQEVTPSGINQILIPDIYNQYSKEEIRNILSNQKTHYLFTWGEKDSLLNQLEAVTKRTCQFFSNGTQRIQCIIHEKGHLFPEKEISYFVDELVN